MFFFYEKPVYKKLSTRTSEKNLSKLQKNLFTLLFFEFPLFCLKFCNQFFHKNLSRIYYSCYMFGMPKVSLDHYYSI